MGWSKFSARFGVSESMAKGVVVAGDVVSFVRATGAAVEVASSSLGELGRLVLLRVWVLFVFPFFFVGVVVYFVFA